MRVTFCRAACRQQRDVKERMLDNFINTADKLFRMTDR